MESLIQLVELLSDQKARHNKPLVDSAQFGPKMELLYQGIRDGHITSNKEGLELIFGTAKSSKSFSSLKSRLEKKLISTLFLIDVNRSSFNDYNVAYYESFRYWAAVKILLQKKSYRAGLKLAEKLFKYSVRYEIHELTISIARDLRRIFGTTHRNDYKYKKYSEAFKKYHPIYLLEIEAEELFATLHRIISKKTNLDYSSMSPVISKRISHLEDKQVESFLFNKYFYVASIYHEQLNGNNSRIIDICDTAIEYFSSKKYPTEGTLIVFYNRMAIAFLNTNRYEEASKTLSMLVNRSSPGLHNWHLSMALYFLVKMYMFDYNSALKLHQTATKPKNVKRIQKYVLEIWQICNAYLQFLIVRQKLIVDVVDQKRFSINKFLNEVPQYSKDKQGLNVAIHIIHILFLVHLRKYDVIIDRMESLQLYTYRHLRRGATFRSNCFIKMLIQIPKGNFTRKRVERYADKYWQKLQTAPVDVNHQQATLEIIPYETLWGMVLDMLD